MSPELARKYAAPVPRYTSYPTAPHFSASIGAADYAEWLTGLQAGAFLSLYVHIPFCDSLCWYCGCNTKATRRYEPVASYLGVLLAEMANVSMRLPARRAVQHVHWGGGSPNILEPDDIRRLSEAMRARFQIDPGAEFAVEVDPRRLSGDQVRGFAEAGVNRLSIGVQDFDAAVQQSINRKQSFETTKRTVDLFRQHGIASVNIDLVYGLPRQTCASAEDTVGKVLALAPERIALFGYAHLPERLKHQRLIDETALPGTLERFAQSSRMAMLLGAAGYVRVGLDHFARPRDRLAQGRLHRNFQGYTSDQATTLIGLGASAIGSFSQGYVQNAVPAPAYARLIREQGLATVRGIRLTEDDRLRGFAIERLMCDLAFPAAEIEARFGAAAEPLLNEARDLAAADVDGLIEPDGTGFRVTERGRPFLRAICARFDRYLRDGAARHSAGV